MGKNIKYVKNAPLKVGDTVICMHMDDKFSPVHAGTPGTVTDVKEVYGDTLYSVKWKTGSTLSLIDGVDMWKKVVIEDDINENILFITTKESLLKEIKRKKY